MTTPAAATALLLRTLPGVRVQRFLSSSAFRLGQGQSATYRQRRWLLVGDAAHAMGPSAGAGMMIGVLGAWRLGHRLAQAVAGPADAPLDHYDVEQRAAATRVQRDNSRIFANLAVHSVPAGAVRNTALRAAGRIPALTAAMARTEALLHLPRPASDELPVPA